MAIETLRRFYRPWLPLVFLLTAGANLVVNEFVPLGSQPYRSHASASLTHLTHTEQPTVDRRFGLYMELGDVIAGGTLVVPIGSRLDIDLAEGLSGITVLERDYDATDIPAGVIPKVEPMGLVEVGEEHLPYWVLPGEGDDHWWLAHASGGLVVVPKSGAPIPEARS